MPGLIANLAPASVTACNCSALVTVPAPIMASGSSVAINLITSSATGVRNVTSKTLIPPAINALASGTAWAKS